MKRISKELGLLLALVVGLFSGCSDPALFGSGLLEEDQLGVEATDTVTLHTTTQLGMPVITSDTTFVQASYLMGRLDDPYFGVSVSNLYIQPTIEFSSINFAGARLDSIVLILPYDSTGLYGLLTAPFGVEVFRVEQDLPTANLRSDATFAYDPNPLGSATFVPSLDSVEFYDYSLNARDTLKRPQLRIPLSNAFGEEIMALDTSFFSNSDAFQTFLRGLVIRPTSDTKAMLGFNLLDAFSGMMLYYTRNDTLNQQFQFNLNIFSVRYAEFQHDHSTGLVQQYLSDANVSDSLVFVQGMAGVMGKVSFPHADQLGNIVVNKAELYLPVASESNVDFRSYPLIERIIAYYYNDEGELVPIDDVQGNMSRRLDLNDTYGGTETYDNFVSAYKLNISSHFQKMVEGGVSKDLYFSVLYRDRNPERSILYGATHSRLPMKLNLTYTPL